MGLRHAAQIDVLPNFTPLSSLVPPEQPTDLWGREIDAGESEDEEIYRLLMPLNTLCDLIERMQLGHRDVRVHRAAYEALATRMLEGCRSASVQQGLHSATRAVDAGNFGAALAALRAIAA